MNGYPGSSGRVASDGRGTGPESCHPGKSLLARWVVPDIRGEWRGARSLNRCLGLARVPCTKVASVTRSNASKLRESSSNRYK